MCGILGVVKSSTQHSIIDLRLLSSSIRHRGPHEFGEFQSGEIALGVRRLSIVDVPNGNQPFYSEDKKITVIFNGQIYNYKAIQSKLINDGHFLRSNCDGEIIPHLYEIHGMDFVQKIDGMFSIAIWDSVLQKLYLIRDRIGEKPLIYGTIGESFYFSSELKTFKNFLNVDFASVNIESLGHFLTFGYVPNPLSIFKNLNKLKPGHYLTYDKVDGAIETEYWKPKIGFNEFSVEKNIHTFSKLFQHSIESQIPSERNFGVFLSGGLDSSLVAVATSRVVGSPINTFSIGFDEPRFDESKYSDFVAKLIGSRHQNFKLSNKQVPHLFQNMIGTYDEPFGDSSAIATLALSEFAAKSITVALGGDGGDEIFGGYRRYVLTHLMRNFSGILSRSLNIVGHSKNLHKLMPNGYGRLLFNESIVKPEFSIYFKMINQSNNRKLEYLVKDKYQKKFFASLEWFNNVLESNSNLTRTSKFNLFDVLHYLPDDLMYKVDIASMSKSLEVRSPFLDKNLLEFGLSLMDNQKYTNSGKFLIKQYAENFFPKDFVYRKKMGFGIPKALWMREVLSKECDDVFFTNSSFIFEYFRRDSIQNLYTEFQKNFKNENLIWNLLVLENWARNW